MSAWPSWDNILADEIEDSWAEIERLRGIVNFFVPDPLGGEAA